MSAVEIIPYTSDYKTHFELITKEWLEKYFSIEQFDQDQLAFPEESIIDKGGSILFARQDQEIIGAVAITATSEVGVFEMVKLGVLEKAQGKKVGQRLVESILSKAKDMGGTKVILYSSNRLTAALALYKKLGFEEVDKECGKYARCDIKMELKL
jgi:ribosomal protein S18 acetylase RimI-like enzyme